MLGEVHLTKRQQLWKRLLTVCLWRAGGIGGQVARAVDLRGVGPKCYSMDRQVRPPTSM
jgi:hypothetical protein